VVSTPIVHPYKIREEPVFEGNVDFYFSLFRFPLKISLSDSIFVYCTASQSTANNGGAGLLLLVRAFRFKEQE
jgi:hypothetical protein